MTEQNIIIERLAKKIVTLNLETPATIFLELHKPLTTIFYHSSVFFQPLAAPFFGLERYSNIQMLLSDKNNIDLLITLIEKFSLARKVG